MRTAQVARRAGVNAQTLRYYERRGLLLDLADGGPDNCDTTRRLAETKVSELADRIASLVAMRDSLSQLRDTCTRPRADRECPLLHSLDPNFDS